MQGSRRNILVSAIAVPFALTPLGKALAQSTANTDRNGAAYIGEALVYDTITQAQVTQLRDLINTIDTGWTELKWQNDMIAISGVFNAVYAAAQKIEPPPQFSGSRAENVLSLKAYSNYGTAARAAIENGDPGILNLATVELQSALDHQKKSADLFQQELVNGA